MPVGTQGTVKGVDIGRLGETGAQMLLANTYHLALRPGAEAVALLGDLHQFTGWSGPILTDSGGFQIFSLSQQAKVSEQGVEFRSHIDGSLVQLSPEKAMEIQQHLGSDVAMVLDHVVGLPCKPERVAEATWRSVRWAERCLLVTPRADQQVWAIVQGGLDGQLRRQSAQASVALGFRGYAVGGLSVGETPEQMYAMLDVTVPELPVDSPRYLMGVGRPEDLLEAISRGIDLFDCVMPTRNGRNAFAFTHSGPVRLRNARYRHDTQPLEKECPCLACRHSLGYLRHLFQAREMLGPILLSIHNLTYYQRLLAEARTAIVADRFTQFHQDRRAGWDLGTGG